MPTTIEGRAREFSVSLLSMPTGCASPERYAEAMGSNGIGDDHPIAVYNDQHVTAGARTWWSLRVY